MNKIATAEAYFKQRIEEIKKEECGGKSPLMQVMIDFAALHVEAALKAAAEEAEIETYNVAYEDDVCTRVNKQSILSAYPKELIQ